MTDESGKMPAQSFEELKVKDLRPEHGEGYIGVGDVAVDESRACWVWLDAPVFGADFRDVAPILIRRTPDAGYEVRMGGLPDEPNFKLIPTPDASTWVGVRVV